MSVTRAGRGKEHGGGRREENKWDEGEGGQKVGNGAGRKGAIYITGELIYRGRERYISPVS